MNKMNKRAYLIFAFIFTIFLGTLASAYSNTTVVVHGPPFHNQIVRILDSKTEALVDSVYPAGDYTGISNDSFVTSLSKVKFVVIDRYNGQTMSTKDDFPEYPTGGVIQLWIDGAMAFNNTEETVPASTSNSSAGSNSSTNNTEAATQETVTEKNETGMLTGFFFGVKDAVVNFNWKYVYYFVGLILLLGVLVLIIIFGRKTIKNMAERKSGMGLGTSSKFENPGKPRAMTTAERIADAERRIQKAQEEIDEVKDREIKRAERRLETLKRLGNVQRRIDEKQEIGQRSQTKPWPQDDYKPEMYSREDKDKSNPQI